MVIDTSALLAILQDEPERRTFYKGDDFPQSDVPAFVPPSPA